MDVLEGVPKCHGLRDMIMGMDQLALLIVANFLVRINEFSQFIIGGISTYATDSTEIQKTKPLSSTQYNPDSLVGAATKSTDSQQDVCTT